MRQSLINLTLCGSRVVILAVKSLVLDCGLTVVAETHLSPGSKVASDDDKSHFSSDIESGPYHQTASINICHFSCA